MTGTAQTSAEEFYKVYKLDVITIPTHRPMVRRDLPDLVFRTEKGKFQAVVREVKERHEKGQPVLIGTVSIEKNEKLSKFLQTEGIPHELLNAKNHEREALIIAQAGRRSAITVATNMAGRGVDIILGGSHLETESPLGDSVSKLREEHDVIASLGGLHVIGTERHEARRIDNQLRGRAGRQGDPGSSQFFVSLEDELMRIFASSKVKNMMETLGIPEDQPIENKMVSRAIESAQGKIEGFHFDARKHVLEYDDVLNKQRDVIYRLRKEILFADQIQNNTQIPSSKTNKERILEMIDEEIEKLVEFHTAAESESGWNIEEITEVVKAIAGVGDDVGNELRNITAGSGNKREATISYLTGVLEKHYDEREKTIGAEGMRNIERAVMLRAIDILWMDHLDQMEHLRDSVRLRAYGQKDPLVEYKHEGARLFRELQAAIRSQIVSTIFKVGAPMPEKPKETGRMEFKKPEAASPVGVSAAISPAGALLGGKLPPKKEPGRNDACPCGSGKKYKKCHGA